MIKRLAVAVALLALCAWAIVRTAVPPRVVPATAADTVFSAERAMRHVEEIAVRPHAIGMPDHDRVRDYIVGQLNTLGLRTQIQSTTALGTRYQAAGRVQNILAWLPGSDSRGKAVLVAGHYDGVEASPAAGDDAAGTAAILETVRALRARKTPLGHDVIVLITDGEEAGLLGAAAFVREHPWAKDVAVVINFEARGTTGRSFMFETGPGDLAAVRGLRRVGGATAGSVFTTIYRLLANDTDLSELAVLRVPALNFAFADGIDRYHTSNDNLEHLNPGSVQHHGSQMLGLLKVFGNGPLPLPQTGDAVFFDLPFLGLVLYPAGLALPLAILALVLVVVAAWRVKRRVILGVALGVVAVIASAAVAMFVAGAIRSIQSRMPWGGDSAWSGVHGAAVVLLAVAVVLLCYSLARRFASPRDLHSGAIVVWAVLAVAVSLKAPGASYLFTWPTIVAAGAELAPERWRVAARWAAALVAILLLAGLAYGVAVVMLGVNGAGAIALGALTSLVALLLLPVLDDVAGTSRFFGAGWVALASLAVLLVGLVVVRRSARHPVGTALAYVQNADSADAWFGSLRQADNQWTRTVVGASSPHPTWVALAAGGTFAGRKVERVDVGAPSAVLVRDTLINDARRVVLRVFAPRAATNLRLRVLGTRVSTASIDGRVVDTTRYRYPSRDWQLQYHAVPDSGAIVALSIPQGQSLDLEMASRSPGLPRIPGLTVPARPADVVPVQIGDATYVYKRVRF
jgi:hypothetical protein